MVSGQSHGQFESRMQTGCIHPRIAGRGSCGPSGRRRVCAVWGWGLLLACGVAGVGRVGWQRGIAAGGASGPATERFAAGGLQLLGRGQRLPTGAVEVSSPLPAIADRTLTISLAPVDYYYYRRTSQEVRFELVLPQGARRAAAPYRCHSGPSGSSGGSTLLRTVWCSTI